MSARGHAAPRVAVLALSVLLLAGIAGCKRRAQPEPPEPSSLGETETGLASWYGHPFHGRQTANGEIYNMNEFTAAHRTMPFNTWVRVTNMENDLFTTVRINDRGPFIEGRIIDLSRAAAEAIEMLGSGTALVRLEVVQHPGGEASAGGSYGVQVGAFLVQENALRLQEQLRQDYESVTVRTHERPDGLYYRVRVGRVGSLADARVLAQQLRGEANVVSTFVVRLN